MQTLPAPFIRMSHGCGTNEPPEGPENLHIVLRLIHSRKLTWKPKKGPIKTTVPLKGAIWVLGECRLLELELKPALRS